MGGTGWALRGNRLVNVLEVVDQENLVRDLRPIHRMLSSGLTVSAEPVVPVGAKVRIATGPLTGIVGTVIRRGKRDQFVVIDTERPGGILAVRHGGLRLRAP